MVLVAVFRLFFFYDEPCPLLWCFCIFIGNLCAARRSVCLVCMLPLTLIFRWEKFLNVFFFFSEVSLTLKSCLRRYWIKQLDRQPNLIGNLFFLSWKLKWVCVHFYYCSYTIGHLRCRIIWCQDISEYQELKHKTSTSIASGVVAGVCFVSRLFLGTSRAF